MFNLANFAGYQFAWFAVILGAAWGFAWIGAAVSLLVVGAHLLLRGDPLDRKLVVLSALIGLLVDGTLAMTGHVEFARAWPAHFAPLWMASLWMAFAITLNHSLRWLMLRPVAAALAGALGGPLAYFVGAELGALSLVTPALALPLIGFLWIPVMVTFSMLVMRAALLQDAQRAPS